jgi:penicillin-binding protein
MFALGACAGSAASIDPEGAAVSAEPVVPEDIIQVYMSAINDRDYEKMYGFISENSTMSKDDFIKRNKNIYEGIEAANITISDVKRDGDSVSYMTAMDTQAGNITFPNTAEFKEYDGVYKLEWSSKVIFPSLNDDDKVRVSTLTGERGSILDRNGELLVGKDKVYSVGFVPGKMNPETKQADIETVAQLLDMTAETINNKLSEKWVKDDLFVPLKNISYTDEEKKAQLLAIKGVGLNTVKDRVYKLGEAAAALTGYIRSITKEEMDKHPGEGYTAESVIGKVGMESLLEDRIRGIDGCKIYIADKDGNEKQVLAEIEERNGENVTLTIDSAIQLKLYEKMKQDKGTAVVMDPKTGEILALVSTPSYDPNSFILGLTEETWAAYNDEQTKPMYNRFKATYVPGSSIKPIIAAIGLSSGAFSADEDFGPSGTTWKKDGWTDYSIKTLKQYSGAANVQNALVYSDNIYFAKAALKIGGSTLADQLKCIGFGEDVPFEFGLGASTFGKDLKFADDIDIANSGFGQGRVEVNPVYMASVYSAFVNGGDMMTPYLEKDKSPAVWKENVFTEEAVNTVRNAMVQVIDNPEGTGNSFKLSGMSIAGKTGTAEIKSSKEDTEGTELGWFVAYPADENAKQYLVVVMIEDVKDRGGSHYVIPIVRSLFAD